MVFRESFRETVRSFIQNWASWGIFASLAVAFIAFQFVKQTWPGATSTFTAIVAIPIAVAISLVGFVGLAIVVTTLKSRLSGSNKPSKSL